MAEFNRLPDFLRDDTGTEGGEAECNIPPDFLGDETGTEGREAEFNRPPGQTPPENTKI